MKSKIKQTTTYILYTILFASIVCACTDRLDITQNYHFELEIMPYPSRIVRDETAEIRLRILPQGDYANNQFFIRFFQTDGRGELKLDDGRILTPNDLFLLPNKVFRLYYTSHSTTRQSIDIVIENSFGRTVQRTLSFANENPEREEAPPQPSPQGRERGVELIVNSKLKKYTQ